MEVRQRSEAERERERMWLVSLRGGGEREVKGIGVHSHRFFLGGRRRIVVIRLLVKIQ